MLAVHLVKEKEAVDGTLALETQYHWGWKRKTINQDAICVQ